MKTPTGEEAPSSAHYQCPVMGCESHSDSENVTWLTLPSDKNRRKEWITAARLRNLGKICSLHFKPSDFWDEKCQFSKETAVPSRFPWFEDRIMMMVKRQDPPSPVHSPDPSKCSKLTESLKMETEDDLSSEPNKTSMDFTHCNGKTGQNGHFDLVTQCCADIIQSNCREKNTENLIKIKTVAKDISSSLNLLDDPIIKVQSFLANKSFIFKSPLEALKGHPLISTFFKRPFQSNTTSNIHADSKLKDVPVTDGLEIVTVVPAKPKQKNLPPPGELKRTVLSVGNKVLALKTSLLGVWSKGTITHIAEGNPEKVYRVRIGVNMHHKLTAKQLSYDKPPDVQIPVGTRVVARYRPDDTGIRSSMYAGIIAEPPKLTNKYRYLVFFDDGYAQYIEHEDIYIVCGQSADVSDDVHSGMKDFIKSYLRQYPERPMVKLQRNQFIKTEWNGKWWAAKVAEVDGSMVKMCFQDDQRIEWIYRGSTRLGLLFNELAAAEAHRLSGRHRRHNIVQKKPHQPYVEYTRDSEVVVIDSDESDSENKVKKFSCAKRRTGGSQYLHKDKPRNTARKSTGQVQLGSNAPPSNAPDVKSHLGYKETHQLTKFTRYTFSDHICSIKCREKEDPQKFKNKNPFLIPVFLGWERQIRKYRRNGLKLLIVYRSPCGRHLRNLKEINEYLFQVYSKITIDFFSLDSNIVIFRTFRPKDVLYEDKDITKGRENVPVTCVNSLSNEPPPYVEYAAERYPGKGVHLNLDEEFLCGCDCTDNCQDRERCQCQQLTVKAYSSDRVSTADVGYHNRRLREQVVTGIYECNAQCKCGPSCMNRVVQNGLQVRLQMFKTQKKGWGIRCLDDIDAGMFLCIYAGQLLTEQGADEDGHQFGDEYLAELDHIEVAEKLKEDYESDVPDFYAEINAKKKKVEKVEKEEEESVGTSDSEINVCADSDSDFESSLRSTAMSTYATRSKDRKGSYSRDSNSSHSLPDTISLPEDSDGSKLEEKELPDIDFSSSPFKAIAINPLPLSPKSSELVEKTELERKPKIIKLEDGASKVVAKKSLSMKHPLSCPVAPARKKFKYMSIRSYFQEESCYIMDAKSKGNIGRYLNHSCHPNVFVQNVFVDTHDLRFPTVAFFSQYFIDAGTELTWDYNYEVGSVEGKVMYCYCETRKCRGRLL